VELEDNSFAKMASKDSSKTQKSLQEALDSAFPTKVRSTSEHSLLTFLRDLELATPRGSDIHLLLNEQVRPRDARVRTWLDRNVRVHLHFSMSKSSWLNEIERWIACQSKAEGKAPLVASFSQLRSQIRRFLTAPPVVSGPFNWVAHVEGAAIFR
jgi:hypothetical protein